MKQPKAAATTSAHTHDGAPGDTGLSSGVKRLARRNWPAITAATFFLLVSLPATLMPYGRLDDYPQLLSVQSDGVHSLVEWSISFGRPVNFLVNGILLDSVSSVDGLWVLRTTAALSFALAGFILALSSYAPGRGPSSQVAVSALVFALPGTWVFITWAQGAGHGASFLLAAIATYLALARQRFSGPRRWGIMALAGVLGVSAMFGYQTFGLSIPGLILACGLLARRGRDALLTAIWAVPVVVLAFAANVLVVRLGRSENLSARTSFSTDWSAKVDWIFQELLPRVLWPFSLSARPLAAVVVLLGILILVAGLGLNAHGAGHLREWGAVTGLGLMTVVMPLSPLLVIDENWASARAVLAPALTLWLLILALVYLVVDPATRPGQRVASPPWARPAALVTIAAAFVLLGLFSAYRAFLSLAIPSAKEWSEVQTLWATAPLAVSNAEVQLQPFVIPSIPYIAYDEYGILTGSVAWAVPSMHVLAARGALDVNLEPSQVAVSETRGGCDSGVLIEYIEATSTLRLNPTRTWICDVD